MSENRRYLKGLKDKPHHVTIALEDWLAARRGKVKSLAHLYGVSDEEVRREIRRGNVENRTFRIRHVVPLFASREELLCTENLRRMAKERNLDLKALQRSKRTVAHAYDAGVRSVPPALPLDIGGALAQVLTTRVTTCFGLHLIVTAQNEDAEQQSAPSLLMDVAVRAHLERLPLPVLHRLISDLCEVRAAWKRDLLAPSAAAAVQEQALLGRESINALLYHVCLWQRRYPLELLSAVLSFYDEHKHLFSPATSERCSASVQLESLLEEVQCLQYPDLSDVPGLIRCDVFMTYPHMPLGEQRQLMHTIAAAVVHRKAAGGLQRQSSCMGTEEKYVTDNLLRHSRTPPDPRLLLRSFVVDGAAAIPERFCTDMPTQTYHEMRAAFERHKHDGVRRLAAQDYGQAVTELTPPPPPPPPQPAASSVPSS
ncbi:conserved hypothetical protein [Leishmania major strain Friedlin]|uniref:Uncharacterized protein n=1 Tax=Leishmania major TaxID=5664 RepID=Q4QHA4_LEIMA|nr:conserved hypothetical protein [Leishmania major strain Friedlin]CAG9570095.1 hypothetical_protein_-_conserved [Leishmania major strain Friedlin]CAJ02979.1 conserved hypothetical protein [Leishmania major strain Friedlin]|eukprot:XP_001681444.1 conserved hypothetical protein [Leishmania major strain Friedlin]